MADGTPSFFVPGTKPGSEEAERRYEELRATARSPEGVAADARRIFSLSCRHAGRDCIIEVGKPSPLDGGDVLAIFDLGSRLGYQIVTTSSAPDHQLGRHVYSVTEFA